MRELIGVDHTAPPIAYLGDGHVRYFQRAADFGLLAPHEVSGVEAGGATAVGVRNPRGRTSAIQEFCEWLRDVPRTTIVVLHLGEADCGFIMWYRAAKYETPLDTQMREAAEAYFDFVDELLGMGFSRIVVTAATLPTITDEDQVGAVVHKRSAISATQVERTRLTLEYNAVLRQSAAERGLPFADITEDVLDVNTGLVAARVRNSNPEYHYMDGNRAAIYWANRIRTAVSGYYMSESAPGMWRARQRTVVKAFPTHSRSLPDDLKREVGQDTIVRGNLVAQLGKHLTLADVRIDRRSYPLLRVIHSSHFLQVDGHEARQG